MIVDGSVCLSNPVSWAHPLNRGLVAWWLNMPGWTFGSTWRDLCGRSHGTLTNMDPATDWVGPAGRPGGFGALDFDGTNDRTSLTIPTTANLTAISISLWVYARTHGGANFGRLVSGGSDAAPFGVLSNHGNISNTMAFAINGINLVSSAFYTLNAWHHIACVFDSGVQKKIYIDGVERGSTTQTATLTTATAANLGDRAAGSRSHNGLLDDVRLVYGRAYSADEVRQLYQDSRQGYPGMLNRVASTRRYFYSPGGGGGSFKAAWAAGSNVLIGAGSPL